MAKPMFLMIAMIVMAPMAAVVSATPSYGEFEQYCDFGFNDAQNTAYTPHDVVAYSSTVSIVEVDPGFYFITFDCTSGVQSGTLTIDVEGRSQDGVTTQDPSTVVPVSSTTVNMVSTTVPIAIDATGAIGSVVSVNIDMDAVDHANQDIQLSTRLAIIPLEDTSNDTTPRVSFWYGRVNTHNDNGTWMTDPDGVSGGGLYADWGDEGWADRKVEYCQKFWPNTVEVEMRTFVEKIMFYNRGNVDPVYAYKYAYDCIQGEEEENESWPDVVPLSCDENMTSETMEIFSNESATTVTSTGQWAFEITPHPAWDANIPGAHWVWNTSNGYGYNGVVGFEQEFVIPTDAVDMTGFVVVAADNSYGVEMNGDFVGEETDERNFEDAEVEMYSLDSSITQGTNVLAFEVNNWHVIGGLMYAGVVQYCVNDVVDDDGTDNGTDNGTGNGTGNGTDNGTGNGTDNGTGNGTDNGTGNGTTVCICNGTIKYVLIEEQWATFDHKVSIKTESLTLGVVFSVDWVLTNDATGAVVASASDVWTATQSTHYTYGLNLDLDPGTYCATANLYGDGSFMDTKVGCKTIIAEDAHIHYVLIQEQWATFDHQVSIKTESLQNAHNYEVQWTLVNDVTQVTVASGTDSWTATQSTHYTYGLNIDLDAGVYCATAELFENSVSVDTKTTCKTITVDSANIAYAMIQEQWGTFDHQVAIKSQSLDPTQAYVMSWTLTETTTQMVVATGTDSWSSTQSTHYTYGLNLVLAEGTYCVVAELIEGGVTVDTKTGCITIECEPEGGQKDMASTEEEPPAKDVEDDTNTEGAEAEETGTGEEESSEDADKASPFAEALKAIFDAISEWFAEVFNKAEPKEIESSDA